MTVLSLATLWTLPKMRKMMSSIIPVYKHKNETLDTYSCSMCGKVWKSSAKRIGHRQQACDKNYQKRWNWK